MDTNEAFAVSTRKDARIAIRGAMVGAALILLATSALSQSSSPGDKAKPDAATAKASGSLSTWKVPRTRDGHPDFQGGWGNGSITPLQRPPQWAGRQFLTDQEVENLKRSLAQLDPTGDALTGDDIVQTILSGKQISNERTGSYNQFWMADRDFDNRTSRIIDPPDGRIPPLTAEAQARRQARVRRNNAPTGPEDLSPEVRCISYGVPITNPGLDSFTEITQTPGIVAIMQERIHDLRIIPTDARPHLPSNFRQWMGDSVGHWEGDTLVVETTNYSPDTNLNGATDNLKVVERYTRISEDYLNWEITYIDPDTWTRPWTEQVRLKRSDKLVYEYACHEGNYSIVDILDAARVAEKAAQAKGSQ